MSKSDPTVIGQSSGASVCSSRAFAVGDCVILNHCEQPAGSMVAVVVGLPEEGSDQYAVQYLNADERFDTFNEPPMRDPLDEATRVQDFGVTMLWDADEREYWCESVLKSDARYKDGETRKWQERYPVKYKGRRNLFDLAYPFSIR
jgi:hypothetical protein